MHSPENALSAHIWTERPLEFELDLFLIDYNSPVHDRCSLMGKRSLVTTNSCARPSIWTPTQRSKDIVLTREITRETTRPDRTLAGWHKCTRHLGPECLNGALLLSSAAKGIWRHTGFSRLFILYHSCERDNLGNRTAIRDGLRGNNAESN